VPHQPQTYVLGVNNAGDVVGTAGSGASVTKAFKMHNGRFTVIQVPGESSNETASGINNLGVIATYSIDGIDSSAYEYRQGRSKKLIVPGASGTEALGINDGGIVVGVYFVSSSCYGFAFNRGKYVSFGYPGAVCTGGEAINASGQIVGQYSLDNQTWHGFVTSPIAADDFR
jgi:probable HAF family extracellular repeat protein